MNSATLLRGSAFVTPPEHDCARAYQQVRLLRTKFSLDEVCDPDALVAHVQRSTGVRITIEPLPAAYPSFLTGLINLVGQEAVIQLPRESGVYPAHVLFHEIGHLLMWAAEPYVTVSARTALLACSDEYVEFVAETLAHYLSDRLLRVRAPYVDRLLG